MNQALGHAAVCLDAGLETRKSQFGDFTCVPSEVVCDRKGLSFPSSWQADQAQAFAWLRFPPVAFERLILDCAAIFCRPDFASPD